MNRRLFATAPAALFLLSTVGCSAAPTDGEASAAESSASTSAVGLTAAIAITRSGSNYNGTLTLTNKSAEPNTNWQVLVNMGPVPSVNTIWPAWTPEGAASVNGAEFDDLGPYVLFSPLANDAVIQPGKSVVLSWTGTWNGFTPVIVSVDGVASGAPGAGAPADGVDPVARMVATTALSIAMHYEKDKLKNNGDSLYGTYDKTLWSSQSYRVASNNATIEFDPIAPGYVFVPNSAKADLAFAQLDPMVASYLTAGLVSCFAVTDGQREYGFRSDFLKGFTYPGVSSGSVVNSDKSVDSYSVAGTSANGGERITVTAKSSTDTWFGIVEYINATSFPSYWTKIDPKYQGHGTNTRLNPISWHGHQRAGCSPFNGPGGSTNPYFVITQDGQSVPAWYYASASNCINGCTGTAVLDPIPYAEPGDYYSSAGLMGTQSNPFAIQTTLYADPAHASQWATRVTSGVQQWGTFSVPVVLFGTTMYKYAKKY